MAAVQLFAFIVLTIGIVYYSRASLRQTRSHGFYRFFAFEAIVALFVLNAPVWFHQPFSLRQIAAWILLSLSLFLAWHGFTLLKNVGRPLGSFEDTIVLVQRGAYRYIRHPLYASLLCLTWGIFLKDPGWLATLLALSASAFLFATARAEEGENLAKFGQIYAGYMRETKRFIPYLFLF